MRELKLNNKPDPADVLDYKEKITNIYFVRHGQTKANKLQLLFGHLDWDLTKEGIRQAKKAAKHLVEVGLKPTSSFHYIISSPLKRTRHTAKIIAKSLVRAGFTPAPRLIIDKNLIEKSEGVWEGKSFWDVRQEDPKNYLQWIKDPFNNKPPKGESVKDLNKRVKDFHKTVLKKYSGKSIIVVSHSGPIRLFLLNLLGVDIRKFWYLKVECGSISRVNVSKKHSVILSINGN